MNGVIKMHFASTVVRPPYEAQSMFLQVTSGCSHKKCTFCGYFKNCAFNFSPIDENCRTYSQIYGYFNPYIDVESGDDEILKKVHKGYDAKTAREQLEKILD